MSVGSAIDVAKAEEQLRQQRETFNQKKSQDRKWFVLRFVMGWVAVVLLPAICGVAGYVLINHQHYATTTLAAAGGALFVDALGLVGVVWKLVLGKGPGELAPVTTDSR